MSFLGYKDKSDIRANKANESAIPMDELQN